MQYYNIGTYIRNRRIKTGKSLNTFAADIDLDSSILSRIENSKQDIKLQALIKIAKGFEQTPAEFLKDFENKI